MSLNKYLIISIILLIWGEVFAQNLNDTAIVKKEQQKPDKVSLLTYIRVISDNKGNVRADQNIAPTFRLVNWLNLQVGLRYGEKPQNFNSYYHYKVELKSKWFWKTVRVLARMSDNVITAPPPTYRKTNKLIIAEAKYPISSHFLVSVGGGYVFSSQQNNVTDALPTNLGTQLNYPIFKLSVRYTLKNKGFLEATYGSYDVFNPYYYKTPFMQVSTEQELSPLCTFYSYFRYQYNNNVFTPVNYFFCAGIRFHLVKG